MLPWMTQQLVDIIIGRRTVQWRGTVDGSRVWRSGAALETATLQYSVQYITYTHTDGARTIYISTRTRTRTPA